MEKLMQKPVERVIGQQQTLRPSLTYWLILMLMLFSAVGIHKANAEPANNHPLIGKLWLVEKQQFVDKSFLKNKR